MLVKVKYWNNKERWVDDITLNELVKSKRIKELYRPSEDMWVNVYQLSDRNVKQKTVHRRRLLDQEKEPEAEQKENHFLSRLLRKNKLLPRKEMTAEKWFDKRYSAFYSSIDYHEAVRCMAKAIDMNPNMARACLIRGMANEASDNHEQAIMDYDLFVRLAPTDSKGYYIRGMAYWRNGDLHDAYSDLETAAAMGHKLAQDFLKAKRHKF